MNNEESKPKNNGLATASLTLGILATVLGVVGIGAILGILAIVFGAISIKDNKGKSLAGIITGAIGILLFVFVMVAIFGGTASLQINQRDTQRKNDVSVLASDIIYYMSNNRGQLPDNKWVSDMTYELTSIDGVTSQTPGEDMPTLHTAIYVIGEDCSGIESTRNFAITILLENGAKYCQGS